MLQISLFMLLTLLLTLSGCNTSNSTPESQTTTSYQTISARDDGLQNISNAISRPTIYRAKIPSHWMRKDPDPNQSNSDTTQSICEFSIVEQNDQTIRITLHNFPSAIQEDRIPALAQIARWKRQFSTLHPSSILITPQSFAGYAGQLFEGTGLQNNEEISIMAWTMQLAQEHYSMLMLKIQMAQTPAEKRKMAQMKSDFTIKALGPKNLMEKHRRAIIAFARSFELIEEIPSSS